MSQLQNTHYLLGALDISQILGNTPARYLDGPHQPKPCILRLYLLKYLSTQVTGAVSTYLTK